MKSSQKKILIVILLLCLLSLTGASADAGPKPSITLKVSHVPGNVCYVDILIDKDQVWDTRDMDDESEVVPKAVESLKAIDDEGWRAAMTNGLSRIMGEPRCELVKGAGQVDIGYRTPERFKVVVVTEDGKVAISNIVENASFSSVVYFDFESKKAYEESPVILTVKWLPLTLTLTLIIEGALLILFGFGQRENWLTFIKVNVLTQLILLAGMGWGNFYLGFLGAFFIGMIAEVIIFVIEVKVYVKRLVGHTVKRRMWYGLTANFASLTLGSYLVALLISILFGF